MRRDLILNTQTNKSCKPLKLFIGDVCSPKTSWKAVAQQWAGSHETSVPKVAVGPRGETNATCGAISNSYVREMLVESH